MMTQARISNPVPVHTEAMKTKRARKANPVMLDRTISRKSASIKGTSRKGTSRKGSRKVNPDGPPSLSQHTLDVLADARRKHQLLTKKAGGSVRSRRRRHNSAGKTSRWSNGVLVRRTNPTLSKEQTAELFKNSAIGLGLAVGGVVAGAQVNKALSKTFDKMQNQTIAAIIKLAVAYAAIGGAQYANATKMAPIDLTPAAVAFATPFMTSAVSQFAPNMFATEPVVALPAAAAGTRRLSNPVRRVVRRPALPQMGATRVTGQDGQMARQSIPQFSPMASTIINPTGAVNVHVTSPTAVRRSTI